MGEFLDYFKNKKALISLLILGVLVLALPLGVELVRRQQIFKSRASGEPIVFTGPNVEKKGDKWVAFKPQITVEITSPLGPPATPTPTPVVTAPPPPKDTSPIISYEAFHFTGSSGQKVIQKFISKDGGHWERKCTVSGNDVNCPGNGWVKDPSLFLAPDGSGVKIITFGAFTYKGADNKEKIVQSIVAANGDSWTRTCAVSGDDPNCPGWDKFASGQTTPDGSKILSYAAFSYSYNDGGVSGQKVPQSYIAENGKNWARTCTVSGDTLTCAGNGWQDAGSLPAPDGSDKKIVSYAAFSYTGSSSLKIIQTLVAEDGRSFVRTTCSVVGDAVDCPRTGGVWGNGWEKGPQISAP
ncbi:hypothetical protein HYU95_00490 [Candidatus Daviesbacteria bacterium]|nr:hypothetical protein [Candidatus Daviesbacteria bacterium]